MPEKRVNPWGKPLDHKKVWTVKERPNPWGKPIDHKKDWK